MHGMFLLSLLIASGVLLQAAAVWLRRAGLYRAALGVVAVIPALVMVATVLAMRNASPSAPQSHPGNAVTAFVALGAIALLAIAVALIRRKRAGLLFWCVWGWNLVPLALLVYLRFFFHIF